MAPIFDTGACLWCDVQILDNPMDYSYIAKPFGINGMPPDRQLELFKDYGWFDLSKLEGFEKEAIEVLKKNENIPEKRLSKIQKGIERNISSLADHAAQYKGPRRLKEAAREAMEVSQNLNIDVQISRNRERY